MERIAAQQWYNKSKALIENLYGVDSRLFTRILAATSPRKSVVANWKLADRIYRHIKDGLNFDDLNGILPAHRPNILRVINNLPLSGNKVKAFAANLLGNLNEITIDVWIKRWYEGLTDVQIKNRIRRGAIFCDMKPAEYQAIIWTKCRIKHGKRPISYNNVPDLFQLKMWDN